MLRRLDGVGLQAVGADTLGIGEAGQDGLDAGGAQFCRLLDDEIGAGLLDRREEEPEIGWVALRGGAAQNLQRHGAFARLRDPRPPFAVAAVEERDLGALALPHDACQVVALALVQRQGRAFEGCVQIEPDFRGGLCHNAP